MSEKTMRLESTLRQKPGQWTAATSWLRGSGSAEPRVSEASCVMHVHYPLHEYPSAVKIYGLFPSFPSSAWEREADDARRSLESSAFPGGAWEREKTRRRR